MFRNPFSFEGRIRRLEYGLSSLIYLVCIIIMELLVAGIGSAGAILFFLMFAPLIWFMIAQSTKRCHDLDKSGWWQLIPFYGIVMLFQDGNYDANEYGSNPKTGTGDALPPESEILDQHFKNTQS
jgi:uncharacterized membrane protein YhaH (DUF805 family)